MRILALAILLLALATPASAAPGPELLQRLADESAEGYEEALDAWEALSEAEQIELLREALAGAAEGPARIAARALGPEHLSAAEIRRQMDLRVKDDPLEWVRAGGSLYDWAPGSGLSFGGPDVVRHFQAAVADPECRPDAEAFQQVHRAANPDHLPGLVSLLDRGTPEVFTNLLWTIDLLATYDAADRHRQVVARAFLYALARQEAEAKGEPVPPLATVGDVEVGSTEAGLPDAFVRLIEDEITYRRGWPRRWARDLQPGAKDVALLMRLVRTRDSYLPFWALRHLVRIGTPEALAFVEEVAAESEYPAIFAAGALFEAGRTERWEALWADPETREAAAKVAWVVDPARARQHWLEDVRWNLGTDDRHRWAVYEGVRVRDEDLAWIADRIDTPDRRAVDVAWFFSEAYPEGLTKARAESVAARLRDLSEEELRELNLDLVLGLLEVSAPEALRSLLDGWASTQPWAEIYRFRLGLVTDRSVLVESWLDAADEDLASEALIALAVLDGLPVEVALEEFQYLDGALDDEEPLASVRRLLLAGKPFDAVRRLNEDDDEDDEEDDEDDEWWLSAAWGLIQDPRVRALAERARAQRHRGLYWSGTAALALAGDEEAREEFLAFLADDRTWYCDSLAYQTLALAGDLALAPVWIAKIDHNCCTAFHAHTALKRIFPTLPYGHNFPVPLREVVTDWYERGLRPGFAWSRILRGWVPKPPPA